MDSRRQREAWFSERAGPLISKMVEDMTIEQPDNPRAWIADYMERGENASARDREEARRSSPSPSRTKSPAAMATTESSNQKEEADTEDPEDVVDLNSLLLPAGGTLPLDVERFSLSYSRALLSGWVKQGSPCCAAASIAGAWNALTGKSRSDAGALNSETVLRAMRVVIEEQIAAMIASFGRRLGGSVEPLLQELRAELALEGSHLGGRGPKAMVASGPHLLRLTRSVTYREHEKSGHSDTFDRLWELYEDECREASALTATAVMEGNMSAGYVAGSAASSAACGASSAIVAWTDVPTGNTPTGNDVVNGGGLLDDETDDSARVSAVGDFGRPTDGENPTASMDTRVGGDENETDVQRNGDVGARGAGDDVAAERPLRRPSSGGLIGATRAADRPSNSLPRRPESATSLISNHSSLDGEHGLVQVQEAVIGTERGGAVRRCWGGDAIAECAGVVIGEGPGDNAEEDEEDGDQDKDEEDEEIDSRDGGRADQRGGMGGRRTRKSVKGGKGSTRRGTRGEGTATRWSWKKDLCDLLKRIGGLDKLCATRPSTGAFGNLGVMSTVRYLDSILADSDNAQVTANLFMGKGKARSSRLSVPLSTRDGEASKAKQWAALREAFLVDQQVLLFHLSNHYALIFALREWRSTSSSATSSGCQTPTGTSCAAAAAATTTTGVHNTVEPCDAVSATDTNSTCMVDAGKGNGTVDGDSPNGWTRQILTARRGQRPTAWINFEEARKIMLGWEGYKILAVQRGKVSHSHSAF